MADEQDEDHGLTTKVGPVTVDWPRTIGYYGAIAAAVAFDVIAPPLAAFVAVVPLLKLMKRRDATKAERAVAALFEGAAKPVGGDAESVVRPTWLDDEKAQKRAREEALDRAAPRNGAPARS